MAGVEERVELKFRIYDGTDIGHNSYLASTTTVATLKERLVADWPQEKKQEMLKKNVCTCTIL